MLRSQQPRLILSRSFLLASVIIALHPRSISSQPCPANEILQGDCGGSTGRGVEPPSLSPGRTFHFFTAGLVQRLVLLNASNIGAFCGSSSFDDGYPCKQPNEVICDSSGCIQSTSCGGGGGKQLEDGPAYLVFQTAACYGSFGVDWRSRGIWAE